MDELWSRTARSFDEQDVWSNGLGHCVPQLNAALRRVLSDLAGPSRPGPWSCLQAAVLLHVFGAASAPYSKSGDLVVEAVIAGCGLSLAFAEHDS
jgi:hypothetical protein